MRSSQKPWRLLKKHEEKHHCRARLNASDRQPICVVMHPRCSSSRNQRPTYRRRLSHRLRCGSRYPSMVKPWCARKANKPHLHPRDEMPCVSPCLRTGKQSFAPTTNPRHLKTVWLCSPRENLASRVCGGVTVPCCREHHEPPPEKKTESLVDRATPVTGSRSSTQMPEAPCPLLPVPRVHRTALPPGCSGREARGP